MTKQQCRAPRIRDALGRIAATYAGVFNAVRGVLVWISVTLEA
jgi:hypothetical protein